MPLYMALYMALCDFHTTFKAAVL